MAAVDVMVGSRESVARGRGLKPTKVEVVFSVGKWCCHETVFESGVDNFTVSHVPSGLAVADRLTKKQAVELTRSLSMVLDLVHLTEEHEMIARREVAAVGGRFLKRGEP